MPQTLIFFDTWANKYWALKYSDKKIQDKQLFTNKQKFLDYCNQWDFYIAHNYFKYDIQYVPEFSIKHKKIIDTLYLDTLFNIREKYHNLIKTENNDPLEDAEETLKFFKRNFKIFQELDNDLQLIFYSLLSESYEFRYFFDFISQYWKYDKLWDLVLVEKISLILKDVVSQEFYKNISTNIKEYPIEMAYCVGFYVLWWWVWWLPRWIEFVMPSLSRFLRQSIISLSPDNTELLKKFVRNELKRYYWFEDFRNINWQDIQNQAVLTSLRWEDIIVWLPTWWGKSLIFQLPALIEAERFWKLTLIITPLKSLMKDQVDKLLDKGIMNVAYWNSELNPLEKEKLKLDILTGTIDLLYCSPESLRSRSFKDMLEHRMISRVVIDEAHCLVTWWNDFRTDYYFVCNFINNLEQDRSTINISCFSATTSHDVLAGIKKEFKDKLNKDFKIFTSSPKRENLSYEYMAVVDEIDKGHKLISLLKNLDIYHNSAIIFVRKTSPKNDWSVNDLSYAENLSDYLKDAWFENAFYHGQMDKYKKMDIQNQFINWNVNLIIATKAFGMGIDKENVRIVIHHNIPSSLEDYLQECWRAWRDGKESVCKAMYLEKDLMKNRQLHQSSIVYINQMEKVWNYLKAINKVEFKISPVKLAKVAWFDLWEKNYKLKVNICLMILEKVWFISRWFNITNIFVSNNELKELKVWMAMIESVSEFSDKEKDIAKRIITELYNYRSVDVWEFAMENDIMVTAVNKVIDRLKILWIVSSNEDESKWDLLIFANMMDYGLDSIWHLSLYQQIFSRFTGVFQWWDSINVKWLLDHLSQGFSNRYSRYFAQDMLYYMYYNKFIDIKEWIVSLKKSIEDIWVFIKENFMVWFMILDYFRINSWSRSVNSKIKFAYKDMIEFLVTKRWLKKINTDMIKRFLLFLHNIKVIKVWSWLLIFWTRYSIRILDFTASFTKEQYKLLEEIYEDKNNKIKILSQYFKRLWSWEDMEWFIDDYFKLWLKEFMGQYEIG